MAKKYCYGCRHLTNRPTGAGGGAYECAKAPGIITDEEIEEEWKEWVWEQIRDNFGWRRR